MRPQVLTDKERIWELEQRVRQLTIALGTVLQDSGDPWHKELNKIMGDQKSDADMRYVQKAAERGVDLG